MIIWLRDWWRGWSDEDLASILTKVQVHGLNPGAIIPVTERELLAALITVASEGRYDASGMR